MTKLVKFPVYQDVAGRERPLNRMLLDFPMSLVKTDGVWQPIITPAAELLATAEKYYIGGYTYVLTDAEAADLPPQYVEVI